MTTQMLAPPNLGFGGIVTQRMPSGNVYRAMSGYTISANDLDVPGLEAMGFTVLIAAVSAFAKTRRLAKTAWNNNPHSLGAMPSGSAPGDAPTITTSAFPASGFSSTVGVSYINIGSPANGVLPGFPSNINGIRLFGGFPIAQYNSILQVASMTQCPVGFSSTFTGMSATYNGNVLNGFSSRWESMADAAKVAIICAGGDGAVWRILVNDQYVSLTGAQLTSGGNQCFILDFTSVGGRAIRKIAIEGSLFGNFIGFAVQPTETLFPTHAEDLLRMIVLGDSYTNGYSIPNNLYGDSCFRVMGDYLGIRDVWTSGAPGTGYLRTTSSCSYTLRQRLQDATLHSPDIVAFATGQNDAGLFTPAQIQAEALLTMQAFRAAMPTTPLAVFGVFGENSGPSAAMIAAEQAIQAAFNSWGDPNGIFVPLCSGAEPILKGTGTAGAPTGTGNCDAYIVASDVHPNAAGHLYLGEWMADAFLTASAGMA
jgi:lysophospholipase L1-like esterase